MPAGEAGKLLEKKKVQKKEKVEEGKEETLKYFQWLY